MKTTVTIPGMHCNSCATLVKDVSGEIPSIQNVDVDLETKEVTLEHDKDFDLKTWSEEIESLGTEYKVTL